MDDLRILLSCHSGLDPDPVLFLWAIQLDAGSAIPDLIGHSTCDSDDICTSVITWDYQGAAIPGRLWKEVNSGGSFSEYLYHSDGNVNTID